MDKKIYTSDYYVAFLDVLGAQYFMSKDDNQFLYDLNNIYTEAINNLLKEVKNNLKQKIHVKIFSDNILLAIKINKKDSNTKSKLEHLINLAGLIQVTALKYGHLLRGAITKGKFFIKNDTTETFVYGKALVDAYSIESHNAIYPRIIINCLSENISEESYKQDIDGLYYVNYYHFSYNKNLEPIKQLLLNKLSSEKEQKVKQKIMWSISYHNTYCKEEFPKIYDYIPYITDEEIKNTKN